MSRLRELRARPDDGQLLLLVLVYTLVAALLVTVVVNLSRAYLARRALLAAADGAALTAANQPDLQRVYDGSGPFLPLAEAGARASVREYVRDADLRDRFDGFDIIDVTTDGETVSVTFGAVVHMPFGNAIAAAVSDGYAFDATAHARSPLLP